MLKTATIYRIGPDWVMPHSSAIEDALRQATFTPCGPTQPESFGWVEPRGEKHGALVEKVGVHFIFKLRTEVRAVPASAVKAKLDERVAVIKDQTGRKPGSKEKRELKEEIILELLPRAFPKSSTTIVWLDPKSKLLVVGAGSVSKSDKVVSALVDAFALAGECIPLSLINTNTSASVAMSIWLKTQDAPYNFSIDRECELKLPDSERSAVRYSRHALEIDEIVEHIHKGKVVTQLAMTWNSRVSLVLTESMLIKKIEFLDVIFEGTDKPKGDEDHFEADVAIATGELSNLIPDLLEALGGEQSMETMGQMEGHKTEDSETTEHELSEA